MELKKLSGDFSICQVAELSGAPFADEFCFAAKTDEECSLVCETAHVPQGALKRDDGWKAFRVQGVLDFSLIGILSRLSTVLAENGVGIFAVSTYNTDYILVKREHFKRALDALSGAGYEIV